MTSTASPVTSLREIATCVGLDGTFKVVRDFFGYDTGPPEQLSLKRQFELMNEHYVNINVILVGVESFAHAERAEIDSAIAFMRRALAAVNFGIGPVRWFHIDTDEAAGREHIASDGEAKDLTREWTVDNYAIDVFFVLTYAGSTVGSAPRNGPEDKDIHRMSGVVLAIEGSPTVTGNVLAREVCRYLGLKDSDTDNNLMFPSVPNGAHLTREQRDDLMPTTNGWPPFLNMPCWYEGPWVHW
jgi:hypothetical protein